MKAEIHAALTKHLRAWPGAGAGPVATKMVTAAEKKLGTKLPADYREFIERYGSIGVGGEWVLGLGEPEFAPDLETVVSTTTRIREQLPKDLGRIVVIGLDPSGSPIGFLPGDTKIFLVDHDFGGGRVDLADSFEEYLGSLIRKAGLMG